MERIGGGCRGSVVGLAVQFEVVGLSGEAKCGQRVGQKQGWHFSTMGWIREQILDRAVCCVC